MVVIPLGQSLGQSPPRDGTMVLTEGGVALVSLQVTAVVSLGRQPEALLWTVTLQDQVLELTLNLAVVQESSTVEVGNEGL